MSLKTATRNKIMKYTEDVFALVLSGFAVVAASGNNLFFVVILITFASICKAVPSLLIQKEKKMERAEDWLLLGFALIGLMTYLYFQNVDLVILLVSIGIGAKAVLSLIDVANNRKERFEDTISLCFVTVGAISYFSQGDPTPNIGLLFHSSSLITKTSPSLWMVLPRAGRVVICVGIGVCALGGFYYNTSIPPLKLAAGTGCDGTETQFRVPLTVGFQLVGGPDDIIHKAKKWHFLGKDNPYTNSSMLVQSFRYDNNIYKKYPPNGNYYDVWVDIGHTDRYGNFHFEESSDHCYVSVLPTGKLNFLNNNPDQWQGYIVQGESVGFDVSLHDESAKLTWDWDDDNPSDGPKEIKTDDKNPSHKYTTVRAHTVTLIVGPGNAVPDQWYFPVLVIPQRPFTGNIEAQDINGSTLFKTNDTLSFSFMTHINPPIGISEEKSYSWVIGNGTTPICQSSPTINHKFPKSGNFLVSVTVTDPDCITPQMVASTIISVLDPPSIKIDFPPTPLGGKEVTVSGLGFPPGDTVKITIDNADHTKYTVAESNGHFTTRVPFKISELPYVTQHIAIAESEDEYDIKSNTTFTIP